MVVARQSEGGAQLEGAHTGQGLVRSGQRHQLEEIVRVQHKFLIHSQRVKLLIIVSKTNVFQYFLYKTLNQKVINYLFRLIFGPLTAVQRAIPESLFVLTGRLPVIEQVVEAK